MRIAIHHRKGSFSDFWILFCKNNKIDYKVVNAYDSEIIKNVKDCDIFMWHHDHNNYKDLIVAKKVLFALEQAGKIVFPNFKTGWHFDDKVAQKYLLEAFEVPLVSSEVFYDETEALKWIENADFPVVFKLKGGSGASNVKLLKSKYEAQKLTKRLFGKGISSHDYRMYVSEKWRHFLENGYRIKDLSKIIYRYFIKDDFVKNIAQEKNYIYFQKFIPNNKYDTRVVVVNGKAMAERRFVRSNDFRASGSGKFDYTNINLSSVEIALKVALELELQSVAFDFIEDEFSNPLIVEISYGFGTKGILEAPGYWDSNLNWNEISPTPELWIIESVIEKFKLCGGV